MSEPTSGQVLSCALCGEPLSLTPWGPVGERGPCRPIDAEMANADDDGLHVLMTPASLPTP